ncbi:endoglin [Limosa lapponica baueri]|uniref:Endoglin n=1 Tax=Limosa lapponica baueri TaxID=1758121 RepID=A0A2I0TCX8_LIMLA|nr:endoglin [Limosa lapponica baueri]
MGPRAAPLLPLLLALLGRPGTRGAGGAHDRRSAMGWGCPGQASPFPLKVSVVPRAGGCTRQAVLVLLCARCSAIVTSTCSDLLVHTDAHLSPGTTMTRPELPTATSEGQLLDWAQSTYGGITSYSKLRDPRWVQLRLGEDASKHPECIPKEHFNAMPHLETEVFFHGMKGCSRGDAQSTGAAHIVRLQAESSFPVAEVNLSLSCPEGAMNNQILILQSQANLTWSLSVNNCHIQFLSRASSPKPSRRTTASSPPTPSSPPAPVSAWRSRSTVRPWGWVGWGTIDPGSGDNLAEPTFPIFLQLILNLSKGTVLQSVRVAFQCNIPRELFLRLFPTAAFEVPQTELEVNKEAFVQASMRWEDHPADLQLKECWLVAPGQEPVLLVQGGEARGAGVAVLEGPPSSRGRKVWRFRFTYTIPEGSRVPFSATLKCKAGLQNNTIFEKVLEVTVKDSWRPPNNRGLGLAAVLGITFGAFLIGALLTAGLWYIYSHTREYPPPLGMPTVA